MNAEIGSTDAACGQQTNPCKHLQQAVEKYTKADMVIIRGVQTVTSTIKITKDLSIVGQDKATITGTIPFLVAFKITSNSSSGIQDDERVNFTVSNITFNEISIISIHSKSLVRVVNCAVHHTSIRNGEPIKRNMTVHEENNENEVKGAAIRMVSEAGGSLLEVSRSIFIGWRQGYVIKTEMSNDKLGTAIVFDQCMFEDHLGIELDVALKVSN